MKTESILKIKEVNPVSSPPSSKKRKLRHTSQDQDSSEEEPMTTYDIFMHAIQQSTIDESDTSKAEREDQSSDNSADESIMRYEGKLSYTTLLFQIVSPFSGDHIYEANLLLNAFRNGFVTTGM
jgi:hypothetical protein